MTITYYVKQVYGKDVMYPADEKGKKYCQLMGRKTLTDQDLDVLLLLNIELKQVMYVRETK